MELNVTFDGSRNLNNFISEITGRECNITSFTYLDPVDENLWKIKSDKDITAYEKMVTVNLHLLLPMNNYHSEILKILENSKGMIIMEEI